jgi:fucose permease
MTEASDSARPSSLVTFRGFSFANVTAMFVLAGATASLYGPLLITFSHRFHISLPNAGVVLSVHFVGAFCGVPLGWLALRRRSGARVFGVTLATMALGAACVALVHHWGIFLVGVFVIGVGFGALDFSMNTLLARTALIGRAHRLSLANAGYGVGAVIGPLLIIAFRPQNFRVLFGAIAVLALVLSTLNGGLEAAPLTLEARAHEVSNQRSMRRPILLTFIVAYVLYVAVETSTSGWIASQLHQEGYSTSFASLVTGGFWLTLAIGRTFGGPLYRRFSDKSLVLGGLSLCIVLAVIAYSHVAAPYAYLLIGLVLASVYPMGLIWYTVLCPDDSNGLALIILFMMLGGVLGPGVESLMVSALGIHAVPLVIAGFGVLDVGVFGSALRFKQRFRFTT